MTALTSRESLLRTMNHEEVNHIPCCFMSFSTLRKRHNENMFELSKAELAMGLDSFLFIPAAGRPRVPIILIYVGCPSARHLKLKLKNGAKR